jgi:hypothetical protein
MAFNALFLNRNNPCSDSSKRVEFYQHSRLPAPGVAFYQWNPASDVELYQRNPAPGVAFYQWNPASDVELYQRNPAPDVALYQWNPAHGSLMKVAWWEKTIYLNLAYPILELELVR